MADLLPVQAEVDAFGTQRTRERRLDTGQHRPEGLQLRRVEIVEALCVPAQDDEALPRNDGWIAAKKECPVSVLDEHATWWWMGAVQGSTRQTRAHGDHQSRIIRPMRLRLAGFLLFLLLPSLALAVDLQVTDSQGTVVVVKDAAVDYGSMLSPNADKEAIRIEQGDAAIRVKWSEVQSLSITKVDSSTKPARIELEVVMVSGTRASGTLLRKGAMTLTGKAPLGEYTISLEKVRRIAPIR